MTATGLAVPEYHRKDLLPVLEKDHVPVKPAFILLCRFTIKETGQFSDGFCIGGTYDIDDGIAVRHIKGDDKAVAAGQSFADRAATRTGSEKNKQ